MHQQVENGSQTNLSIDNEERAFDLLTHEWLESEKNLWYFHDYALALGVKGRVTKNDIQSVRTHSLKNVTSDNYTYVSMDTQSPHGPLRPLDKTVLTVLTSMLREQREEHKEKYFNIRPDLRGAGVVFFTFSELCRRLGYDPKSMLREVKESIERLISINVQESTTLYSKKTKKYLNNSESYKLIDQFGRITMMKTDKGLQSLKGIYYVVLHRSVVFKTQSRENYGWIKSSEYNKLKGIYKSIYEFLCSKRQNFGDTYSFEMRELSDLLNLEGNLYKKREAVKRFLDNIKNEIEGFSYYIDKPYAEGEYTCIVTFTSDVVELEVSSGDSFFDELVYAYGAKELESIEFDRSTLDILRLELNGKYKEATKKDFIKINNVDIDPLELVTDIALYQVLVAKYSLTKFKIKGFIKFLFESLCQKKLTFPDGYSHFVTVRNNTKRKKDREKILVEIKSKQEDAKKIEEEKIEALFEDFLSNIQSSEKSSVIMDAYKFRAKQELSIEIENFDNHMFKESLIDMRMRSILKKDFETGEFLTHSSALVKEQRKLMPSDLKDVTLLSEPQQKLLS